MTPRKPRNSGKAGRWNYSLPALLVIWAGSTALVTMMGPFGTFPTITNDKRLLFWGSVIGLSMVLVAIVRKMLDQILSDEVHPLVHDAIVAPIFTLLYTPPLYFITDSVARGQQPFNMVEQGLIVLAVSVALIGARELMERSIHGPNRTLPAIPDQNQPETAAPGSRAPAAPAILERLPEAVRGDLLRISGSDHYVHVQTDRGSASILLRFSDALREIGDVPGLRVHRSHWVADAAVFCVRRDGYRHFAVLKTGEELPVSRTYAESAIERWGLAPSGAEAAATD